MSTPHRAGLPLEEVVPMTDAEREVVEHRMKAYDRRVGIACIVLFFGITIPCGAAELAPNVVLPIALAIWFLGFPALGLWARDGHRRAGALRRDLVEGVVAVHQGERARFVLDEVAAKVVANLDIQDPIVEARVLPGSQVLLQLQGDLVDGWHELPALELAESPPVRWRAFAKVGPDQAEARPRDLTTDERREIEALRSHLIRMTWVEVALLVWGGLAVITWALDMEGGHWATRLVALGLGGGVLFRFIGRLRSFVLLGRDLKIGQLVVIVGDQSTVELCPGSQSIWTIDGEPAPWRTVKPRDYKG